MNTFLICDNFALIRDNTNYENHTLPGVFPNFWRAMYFMVMVYNGFYTLSSATILNSIIYV